MAVDFTARELADLEKIVFSSLFRASGADRIRLLIILRKLEAENVKKAMQK